MFDQIQFYTFVDYGRLWLLVPASIDPAVGLGGNFSAASAGAGVRLGAMNLWTADLQVAKAIHGIREDTRFFLVLGAKY
jgi:hemolysin activation/secretion protein